MKQIKLTKGQFAIVNNQDFDWLNQFKWFTQTCRGTHRAVRKKDGKTVPMSREIMETNQSIVGFFVDHINRNTLDNRRRNLRLATRSQNLANSRTIRSNRTIHKGVTWKKSKNCWEVRIQVNKKMFYPGISKSLKEAINIYNLAAKKYFGKFANLNR